MAMYEKQLTIDISGEGPYKHITAKQGDKKSRFYRITLVDCGKKITLTENAKVDFRCTKPDENYCIIPTRKNDDGTVSFELDEQVLAVVGVVVSEFVITDDNGMILSTTVFYIHVLPSALSAYYIPSQSLQIMDRNLDMNGYSIQNIPAPAEKGDAANKKYVDEKFKDVKNLIDDKLDENSTNAIQNAVVAKKVQEIKKIVDEKACRRWYLMPVEKLSKEECALKVSIRKGNWNTEPVEYFAEFGFTFYQTKLNGDELVHLTDLPIEVVKRSDGGGVNWVNTDKFPTIGIINTQLGSSPIDLYEQLAPMVDGTTFHEIKLHLNTPGCTDGYHDAYCAVGLESYNESAIDAFVEEMTPFVSTVTHCCLAYDDYQIIEVNALEVE